MKLKNMHLVVQKYDAPIKSRKYGKALSIPILHVLDEGKGVCICGIDPNDTHLIRIDKAIPSLERCYFCQTSQYLGEQ